MIQRDISATIGYINGYGYLLFYAEWKSILDGRKRERELNRMIKNTDKLLKEADELLRELDWQT